MVKQESLEGMEQQTIPVLTEAASELKEIRRQRMDLTKKEVEAAEKLIALLHEHKLDSYRDDNLVPPVEVRLVPGKEKVKVSMKDEEEEGEED